MTVHLTEDSKTGVWGKYIKGAVYWIDHNEWNTCISFPFVAEMSELSVAQKPEKLLERCKYWPACKNGDECAYHHPISPCKAFPNCKFAEKCLFVHPNCKYDAKCTKPDCPFTHVSRRIPVLSPKPGEWLTVLLHLGKKYKMAFCDCKWNWTNKKMVLEIILTASVNPASL